MTETLTNSLFYIRPDMQEQYRKTTEELSAYYSSFDPYTKPLIEQLDALKAAGEGVSSYELKTRMYELLCRICPIHLFEENDFFFEMSSGRERYHWGGLQSEAGSYFRLKNWHEWLTPFFDAVDEDRKQGYIHTNGPINVDHMCAGYDNLLEKGLPGIIQQAQQMLETCRDERKCEFYRCVIRANRALIGLAGRFEVLARTLAEQAQDPAVTAHYQNIADAAYAVQTRAPQTFYEALAMILFYRECVSSIEGIGISILGHLDRMLYPYYKADLEQGRLTKEQAFKLLCDLLLYTDARFNTQEVYWETSTTIEIGGCDRSGAPVYNEVTELLLSAVVNVRSVNTKVNCRISKAHPERYLQQLAAVQLENLPTIMLHNDDVLIPSRVKQGQPVEDARLYVGGGCHEIVLQGVEVCTRAETWINLSRILLDCLQQGDACESFDGFLDRYVEQVRLCHDRIVQLKNEAEKNWCKFDPLVLYSSAITGCLESGMDVTEGGAKHNTAMLSMLGTATVIDSLYAIRTLVYEHKQLRCSEFHEILQSNFEKDPQLRRFIIDKLPKHGTNDTRLNSFSSQVLDKLSTVSGQKNARNGRYMPAFYPHDIYRQLGYLIGATPDGRLAGEALSRGVSPSEFVATGSPLDVIHSLSHIDFTRYADSFIAELTLPRLPNDEQGMSVMMSLIHGFLEAEGSSIQFNLQDPALLRAAQKEPEKHRNVRVRVCGFSAVFTTLDEGAQEGIIQRALR